MSLIGRVLGKYRLVERLRPGALADVYRGIQIGLEREVAVKVLPAALASDHTMRERFRRASQVTARLSHPNIITIFDSGEQDGVPFTVMEHLRSETLEDRLENEGPLPAERVLKLAQDLLKALAYAHEHGVVHRGLSAACVKFDLRQNAIVTDFARVEETRGTAEDDLEAVGRILQAALAGVSAPGPDKPTPIPAEVPAEVTGFVEHALFTGPERFTSARAMLERLKKIELTVRARRISRAIEALPLPSLDAEELPPPCVQSSDSFSLLASLTSLISHDEDRRAMARAFSWATPVFVATLCGVCFLLY